MRSLGQRCGPPTPRGSDQEGEFEEKGISLEGEKQLPHSSKHQQCDSQGRGVTGHWGCAWERRGQEGTGSGRAAGPRLGQDLRREDLRESFPERRLGASRV